MKHTLQIRVSKKPVNSGAVSVRNVSVRERFMRFLLGDKVRLTVIVPGSTVEEPVSYTHLDVYKRQHLWKSARFRGSKLFLFGAILWSNFHDCNLRRWRYGPPVGDF